MQLTLEQHGLELVWVHLLRRFFFPARLGYSEFMGGQKFFYKTEFECVSTFSGELLPPKNKTTF